MDFESAWKDSKHVSVFRVLNLDLNMHVPVEREYFLCGSIYSYPIFFFFSLGDRVVAVNDISLETLTRPKVRIKIVVFTQGIIHLERTQKFSKTNIS